MDIITAFLLTYYPQIIAPLCALFAIILMYRWFQHRRQVQLHQKYRKIRLKRLGGVALSEKETKLYKKYKAPVHRPSLWQKMKPRVMKVVTFPRRAIASIATNYNPLALRDQVDILEEKLNTAEQDRNYFRKKMWDLEKKVKELEQKIPDEIKEADKKAKQEADNAKAAKMAAMLRPDPYVSEFA